MTDSESQEIAEPTGGPAETLQTLLSSSEWASSEQLVRALQAPRMRPVRLVPVSGEASGATRSTRGPLPPAEWGRARRINWLADISLKGYRRCGLMVNYRYFQRTRPPTAPHYLGSKSIKASEQVLSLVAQFQKNSKLSSVTPGPLDALAQETMISWGWGCGLCTQRHL